VIHRKEDTEQSLIKFLNQHAFQGIFLGGEIDERFFSVFAHCDIPVMAIDFYKLHMPADAIIIDNYYASFVATSYLIEKGHTKIGFLGNPKSTSSVSDRFYGYLKALNQNDLGYRKEWHIAENYEAGMFTHNFTLPDPLPTSFVCHCDQAAYSLMLLLRGQEIYVPDQVSIIAFDNTDISQKSDPQITTIDIGKQEIAERALEHMLWRIEHPEAEIRKVEIHTRLIERQTVKALLPAE
jgi:LacI family transcriptional regulator